MKSKVVAITGGIGSGKSEVTKYLQGLGYATLDCDALAKEISAYPQVVEQVRQLLGDSYIADGQLNRKAIRDKIFTDEKLLQKYNSIFFDEVKKLLDERILQLAGNKIIFVEISVYDAFSYSWDGVWLVAADEETRINRAMVRSGMSRKTLDYILSRQNICDNCTLIIDNNGSIDYLKKQVNNALDSI